jgi:hypothetical protein
MSLEEQERIQASFTAINVLLAAKDAEIAALRAALEPFASFGVVTGGLMRDRICDWFGPSDFDAARTALRGKQ